MRILNIIVFLCRSVTSQQRRSVLVSKVKSRLTQKPASRAYLDWLAEVSEDMDQYCKSLDAELWIEAGQYVEELEAFGAEIAKGLPFKMGGPGACQLLFFLARRKQPACIVETGVALGYTSATFLEALKRNGSGVLYSSDFPYPGIPNSERYVGIVVPQPLRNEAGWVPLLSGDETNLPSISSAVGEVGIFHYDSDKSYQGRVKALETLKGNLTSSSVIVFDDIHENSHFQDYCESKPDAKKHVFRFRNKFVGVLGEI